VSAITDSLRKRLAASQLSVMTRGGGWTVLTRGVGIRKPRLMGLAAPQHSQAGGVNRMFPTVALPKGDQCRIELVIELGFPGRMLAEAMANLVKSTTWRRRFLLRAMVMLS
jgi:hypothetical protein